MPPARSLERGRPRRRTLRPRARVALIATLALLSGPLRAQGDWTLTLSAGATNYSKETFSSSGLGFDRLELDGGTELGLAAEYRIGERLGLELSYSQVTLDAKWQRAEVRPDPADPAVIRPVTVAEDSGDFTLQPLSFALLWHPIRAGRFDLSVGPEIAWVDYSVGVDGAPERDAEWAIGAKLAAGVRLGDSPWSAGLALRWLEIQHEGEERDLYTGIGLPIVAANLTYRFRRAKP